MKVASERDAGVVSGLISLMTSRALSSALSTILTEGTLLTTVQKEGVAVLEKVKVTFAL